MMNIIFVLVGLVFGYAIAFVLQRKGITPFHKPPQKNNSPTQQDIRPTQRDIRPTQRDIRLPQDLSSLEEKIWYEAELEFLFKFEERLSSVFGFNDVVQRITEAAHDFLPIERAVFLTWDKDSEKLTLARAIGWKPDRNQKSLLISKDSISGHVVRNREVLVVSDLAKEQYLCSLDKEGYLQKTFISAPLIFRNEVLGVLHVCDKKIPGPFMQREVAVVMDIVRLGAISLQNVLLYEQASKRAVELKNAYDELKQIQEKLIQSEKLKAIGQLASGVAHEMRNPLGIIMQGVTYLEEVSSPEAEDTRDTLSMLKESVQRADKIVNSLLNYSRHAKLELYPENINSILESSLNLVKRELKKIEVVRKVQEDIPNVLADKSKLMQVFINLFINAIDVMPEAGKLTIRSFVKELEEAINSINERSDYSYEAGEKVVIVEVEDTGTGITEENLKRIFDPFFTTKGPGKGTGLGLSVIRNIIIMHKGLIEVKSQVNKGTKVIVTLKTIKE